MRTKVLVLTFALLLVSSQGKAQEITNRHLVVPLADGGFVAFKSETAWTGAKKSSAEMQELPAEFRSEAFVDGDHLLHRLLVDAAGKYVFGYDLLIEADRATKRFKIVVKPLSVEVESKQPARTADSKSARRAGKNFDRQTSQPAAGARRRRFFHARLAGQPEHRGEDCRLR